MAGHRWLMVGTSPTVRAGLAAALSRHEFDRVATCNGGIELVETPDVYVATDQFSTRQYAAAARAAQSRGSLLVTLERDERAMRERDCDWYNVRLTLGEGPPSRSRWGAFRYTGPLTLEYLLRHGAESVVLVGCDGYRHGDARDYWDAHDPPQRHSRSGPDRTRETLGPGFTERARLWPEVPIVQYGLPAFTVNSPNWEVRLCDGS